MNDDRNAAAERLLEAVGREWAEEAAPSPRFRASLSQRLREERRADGGARILGMPRRIALRMAAAVAIVVAGAAFFAARAGREEMLVAWSDGGVDYARAALRDGDAIATRADGRAVAMLDGDRVQVMLARATTLSVVAEDRLRLEAGEVWVSVKPKSGRFEIATPEARVSVRGTRFGVRHDAAGTTVMLEEGTVEVEAGGTASTLEAGASAIVPQGGRPVVARTAAAGMPEWAATLLADWHAAAAATRYPSGRSAESRP